MEGFWKTAVSHFRRLHRLPPDNLEVRHAASLSAPGNSLGFILSLVWLYYTRRRNSPKTRPALSTSGWFYSPLGYRLHLLQYQFPLLRAGMAVTQDYFFGGIYLLLVLEACRRVSGPAFSDSPSCSCFTPTSANISPEFSPIGDTPHEADITKCTSPPQGIFGQPIASRHLSVLFIVSRTSWGKAA